jgi:hypothetical protein
MIQRGTKAEPKGEAKEEILIDGLEQELARRLVLGFFAFGTFDYVVVFLGMGSPPYIHVMVYKEWESQLEGICPLAETQLNRQQTPLWNWLRLPEPRSHDLRWCSKYKRYLPSVVAAWRKLETVWKKMQTIELPLN